MLDWNFIYKSGKDFGRLPDQVMEFILRNVNSEAPKTTLDIGCGTGWLTRELYKRGYSVRGIDTSSEAISIAKSQLEEINYQVTDLMGGEFLSDNFGLITCKHVYAFVPEKQDFLVKVSELLAPNGTFVLITPMLETSPEKPDIAVDGAELRRDLEKLFVIIVDKSLVSGQLFMVRPK